MGNKRHHEQLQGPAETGSLLFREGTQALWVVCPDYILAIHFLCILLVYYLVTLNNKHFIMLKILWVRNLGGILWRRLLSGSQWQWPHLEWLEEGEMARMSWLGPNVWVLTISWIFWFFLKLCPRWLFALLPGWGGWSSQDTNDGYHWSFFIGFSLMASLDFLTAWWSLRVGFLPMVTGFFQKECFKRPKWKSSYN